ncbi:MAG: YceD family protein [Thermoanaerobaculia bacterium]
MKHPNHIALDAVLEEPVRFAFDLPFALAALDREPLLAISPVRLEGTISRIEGGFALEGRCAFDGKLECSRCLAAYPFAMDEPFSLVLYRRSAGLPDVRELSREDLNMSFYEGDSVDLAPIAEERVQMAIPMKPLCREECLGLCPRCGKDRNLAPCGCVEEEGDPRWGALAQWKNATKSQKA